MKLGIRVGTRPGSVFVPVAQLSAQSRGCLGCVLGSGNRLALFGFRPGAVLKRRLGRGTVPQFALGLNAGSRCDPDFGSMARTGC